MKKQSKTSAQGHPSFPHSLITGSVVMLLACSLAHGAVTSVNFRNIAVESNVGGLVEYSFTNAALDSNGVALDARLRVTSLVNGASYIDGNGALINGGQGLGAATDLGASTFDANLVGGDETLFFAIGGVANSYVSLNLSFVRNDTKSAYNLTDTIILQSYDIDKGQTTSTYSDTFGWVQSQVSVGPTIPLPTTNLTIGPTIAANSLSFTTARLDFAKPGVSASENVDNDPAAPAQVNHTVELRYNGVGTGGIDLLWGIDGGSLDNTIGRRGMFLSGQNPPLIQGVPEPSVTTLILGLGAIMLCRRRR